MLAAQRQLTAMAASTFLALAGTVAAAEPEEERPTVVAPPAEAEPGSEVRDLNAIIRALGPVEYLSEHGGRRGETASPSPPSIDLTVPFTLDSARLAPQALRQLDELGAALRSPELAGGRFGIAGHTDASGPTDHNQALSERRAEAVRRYLVERHDIDPAHLDATGHGEARLKDPANPNAGSNRRVEITLLAPPPRRAAAEEPDAEEAGDRIKIDW